MKKNITAWLIDGPELKNVPKEYKAIWAKAVEEYKLKGRAAEIVLVLDGISPSILVGIGGDNNECDKMRAMKEAAQLLYETASKHKFERIEIGGAPKTACGLLEEALFDAEYKFKVGNKENNKTKIEFKIINSNASIKKRAKEISSVKSFARTLVDMPPSHKSPNKFAAVIRSEIKKRKLDRKIKMTIWDKNKLEKEKCNGILAVGKGSANPPMILRLDYVPRGAKGKIVLVGKGLIFDSGGLNLKTYEGMKTMKCDMAGAATVIGAGILAAYFGVKNSVTVFAGLAENMPGNAAFKPGDVIETRAGKTVEVLNTDAEGRLVLADLLNLAEAEKPNAIIDAATLTGACVVALGEEYAGLFSKDAKLSESIIRAAEQSGEAIWRMPMGRDFKEKLKGDISDLKNIGNRYGGASTAAEFLDEFIDRTPWAHLDIAGPAFREGKGKGRPNGATGFGIGMLLRFIEEWQ